MSEVDYCEPDSQGSVHLLTDEENETSCDILESIERRPRVNTLTDLSSSFGSQPSQDSPNFKKYPMLNEVFSKVNRQTVCLRCNQQLKTVEASRLMMHIDRCESMDDDQRKKMKQEWNRRVGIRIESEEPNVVFNRLWTEFMVENNVPIRSVESQSFKKLVQLCLPWDPPNRRIFSEFYIPAMSALIEDKVLGYLKSESDNIISVEFDHWSDINGRSLLGTALTFSDGKCFLHSLKDVSFDGHSARVTANCLKEALKSLPTSAINSIISDSASACKLARELIVADPQFKKLIQHRCLAHLINRMGTDFCENENIKATFTWASRITTFIASSPRLLAILEREKVKRPRRACPVRWYSTINMSESLIAAKSAIITASSNHRDASKLEWMRNESHWQMLSLAIAVLRPLVDCIAVSECKNSSLGEAVRSLLLFAKSLFGQDWKKPLIVDGLVSFLRYFGPRKLGYEEFSLMLAAYTMNRIYKCDFITEDGLDLVSDVLLDIGTRSGCDVGVITDEFAKYCSRKGFYSQSQPESMNASEWWSKSHGRADMKLVGCRISHLRSSSANIERTFSALRWFQGQRRTRLHVSTLMHISRIKIFQNHDQEVSSAYGDTLPIMIDYQQDSSVDDSFDCSTETHETIEDDMASIETLSFDHEPIDYNQHDLSLLPEDVRCLYVELKKFVDFNIINIESETSDAHFEQPELPTSEELERMKKRCREKRLALKGNPAANRESAV